MDGALKGCLVLDLSRLLPGPYGSMILADHGARVIAIEDRRFEKEALPLLNNVNRNKEHMCLNLKSEKGREIFFSLVRQADVLIEGFRPGVTDRLGVGYARLREINPRIIYCSLTGYGQDGPLRDLAGHDINFQGHSGVLSLIGPHNAPPCIPGIQIADVAGGVNAAIGIMMALYARERTGRGQYIDIAITDCLTAMLPIAAGRYWTLGSPPERGNDLLSHRYAFYNVYETADGKYLSLGALEPRFWEKVCNHFGVPEYIELQFDDGKREEIIAFFRNAFLAKTRDAWLEIFDPQDACVGAVYSLDEVLEGENARAREMAPSIDGGGKSYPVLGMPVKLSDTPGSIRTPPPKFGENTHEILSQLGYSEDAIRQMENDGVV